MLRWLREHVNFDRVWKVTLVAVIAFSACESRRANAKLDGRDPLFVELKGEHGLSHEEHGELRALILERCGGR